MTANLECIWSLSAELGESPVWSEHEQALYFVDILLENVHRYDFATGTGKTYPMSGPISALVPCRSGGFLGSMKHEIGRVSLELGTLEPLATVEQPHTSRLNDGKCDAHGCYFTGTMDQLLKTSSGTLYRVEPDGRTLALDTGYLCCNGPTFSMDGRVMYHSDSPRGQVFAFDVAPDGSLSNKRLLVQFDTAKDGEPDGMTTDVDGCIWVAHWGAHRISRFTPEGKLDCAIPVPAQNVTSCAFGGPHYDLLFITSASVTAAPDELAARPDNGGLFVLRPGTQGFKPEAFGY